MYKCCQRAMICRRVPKLSCVQSQPLISHKNSTASITKWAIPTLKTNSLETQRRSCQRMMPDLTCLSRWLSFSPKPWYLPVSSHFFELRLKWLKLASFYSLKILWCWTPLRALVCDQILGNIAEFSFYEIQNLLETVGLANERYLGAGSANSQMCNTFEGLRGLRFCNKCLFYLLGYRECAKMTPHQRLVLS
jgi:hypothetical protein